MTHHEHCQTCGAHFEKHADLLAHVHAQHGQSGSSTPALEIKEETSDAPQRKDHEFTRSHRE